MCTASERGNGTARCTESNRLCCDGPFCDAELAEMHCTREKGHKGDHVACGDVRHNLAVWPQ